MSIIRYQKLITRPPELPAAAGIALREYGHESDCERWCQLHCEAFSLPKPWTPRQFVREFCHKSWWNSSRMWFAFEEATSALIGTVTLAERLSPAGTSGQVAWLAVASPFRRRGVARLLVAQLERAAGELGYQQLEAETLKTWTAANRFYLANGWHREAL